MNSRAVNTKTGAALAGTLIVALAPASALASVHHHHAKVAELSGVVVHENNSAHSFVIAERSGRLDAVHGHRLVVGEKVAVKARKLANGTFAATNEKVVAKRHARRVKLEGVVSADPSGPDVVVSGSGSSIPIDTGTATGDTTPLVGEAVDMTVDVNSDGEVDAENVTDLGQSNAFRVEGKVLAIDDQARTLTISADDDNESGQSVTVTLPASFDISAYSVGDCVELTVSKGADGSLTAVQSFGDGSQAEADDDAEHGRDRGGPRGDRSDHHQDGDGGSQSGSGDQGSSDTAGSGSSETSGSSGSGR